jgi:hypothetical protein
MPKFILILLILFSISCKGKKELNQVKFDKNINSKILVGYTTIKGLKMEPFMSWYQNEYTKYQPDTITIQQMLNIGFKDVQIKLVMGTWCSDSRREVPRFIKVLEELDYPLDSLVIINLDSNKKTKVRNINQLNISKIPTFIFSRNKIEIGRIIEKPSVSLEKDLFSILNNNSEN